MTNVETIKATSAQRWQGVNWEALMQDYFTLRCYSYDHKDALQTIAEEFSSRLETRLEAMEEAAQAA